MIELAFATHIGLVREKQEDAYGNVGKEFFVIADGLGGHLGGEVAANLAVNEVIVNYKNLMKERKTPAAILTEIYQTTNKKIIECANKNPFYLGMGTTLVTAIIEGNNWWMGNIGDSRGYLFSKRTLQQITIDHEEASGALTRAVGLEEETIPDIFSGKSATGDIILLTTDGLTNFVSDKELERILANKEKLESKADQLIQLSLNQGGFDNVTVALIKWLP